MGRIYNPVRRDYFYGPLHVILRKDAAEGQYGITAWSIRRKWTVDLWLGNVFITLRRNDV